MSAAGNSEQECYIFQIFGFFRMLKFIVYVTVKKCCPFKEKCYRKNPIHFSEMSHPHCMCLHFSNTGSFLSNKDS